MIYYFLIILQVVINFIADGFQPLAACFRAGTFHCQVAEPAVGFGTVPMLNACGNCYNIARLEALGGFALFLIPAFAVNAN